METEYEKAMEEKTQEVWGCAKLTTEQCQTCVWSKGPAPYEDGPRKGYCIKFSKKDSAGKPDSVLYDGEDCEHHMTQAEKDAAEKWIAEKIKNMKNKG